MSSDVLSELDQFTALDTTEPHISRARAILQAHPEVRDLLGPTPSTFLVTLALVAAQIASALALRHAPLWVIAVVAYTVGAVVTCGVMNMIHEASHHLIFRSPGWNRFAAYVANLGTLWPSVETFRRYHLPHHRHLGDYDRDPTIPRRREAELVGRSPLRKALWITLYAVHYPLRLADLKLPTSFDRRIALNAAVQLTWLAALFAIGGVRPLVYLALAFYLGFGPHPLNAIALQEHLYVKNGEESYSYYGIGNWITLNAGYHVEHHDFPRIAWSRLRRLHALAPEFYDRRHAYRSWSGLILWFVRDPRFSLWARAVRPGRYARRAV